MAGTISMFDLCSKRLLETEEMFSERNGHHFVEMWDCGIDRTPVYRSGELKEKEVASWVNDDRSAYGPVRSGLRILLCPKPAGKPSSGKLPFSRSTYCSLTQAWRIPSIFIRAVTQKLSIVTQCAVAPSALGLDPKPNEDEKEEERSSSISDEAKCLLVRGDADWTWDYTLLLTFDPVTCITYTLIVGLTATEIDLMHKYLSSPAITSSRILSTHPMLLPVILLDLATDDTSSLLKVRIKLLSQIQQQTGMDRFNSLKSAAWYDRSFVGEMEKNRHELDLGAVMLRLTCLNDWVAAQRGFIGIQRRVVEVVGKMMTETASRVSDAHEESQAQVVAMFQERLDFIRETLLAAEQKCQYLERSINAQVQTIYSLIGQKDNRLNILAANSSCQIASDSRRIAILTRRDSTDMRIIAAVTLLFLPGTFIATVFSTGMFDWGSDDSVPDGNEGGHSKTVSSYIWVYFMLTGVLTFLVLVAWVLFSYVQNRKMMKQFGMDLEEGNEMADKVGKRRDTKSTLVDDRKQGRRMRALKETKRWIEEACGSLTWWGGPSGKKNEESRAVLREELKNA